MTDFEKKYCSKAPYDVAIESDGIACVQQYTCDDHDEAVNMLIADHSKAGDPLPLGTSVWVVGPCKLSDCDCGKTRVRQYITYSSSNEHAA